MWILQVGDAVSLTCIDLYVFATPDRATGDYYFRSKEHTFEFKLWEDEAEYEYVRIKIKIRKQSTHKLNQLIDQSVEIDVQSWRIFVEWNMNM